MHDIRLIRDQPHAFDAALARRGLPPEAEAILQLDEMRRASIADAERALAERNAASREVGSARARGDDGEVEGVRLVAAKKDEIGRLEAEAATTDAALHEMLMGIPNLPYDDVPDGPDERANVELRRWGTPKGPKEFGFKPREHFDVAMFSSDASGMSGIIGAKLSGSRFTVLYGSIARLHRALAQFMLDTHVNEHGFKEVWTPVIVREDVLKGTGQLPKFSDDLYQLTDGSWLIPTAEVTLTNIVADEILDEAVLPLRYTAHTQCFRSEAGSAGKDVRGMLRQHQFEKVEMVSITRPEDSRAEHERMTACAQGILEALGLPYRTVVLSTGDMGFSVRRTHDLEVWLPGQGTYREIASISDCGDFQARRMNARFRRGEGARPEFVHTLNGSGLAVGRTLIAVIENGQEADGSISLPPVLGPYLGGRTRVDTDGRLA